MVLEAIEVHGVRKYLRIWNRYREGPPGVALREILDDEFKHEDMVVTADTERRCGPRKMPNVFLGLNDGLVEILDAFMAQAASPPSAIRWQCWPPVLPSPWPAPSPWPPEPTSPPSSETEVRATEDAPAAVPSARR